MIQNSPLKVAIVGAGSMAREHIRAFRDLPNVSVSGIHSRTRSRAQSLADEFGIPIVCDSVAELYDRSQAELVVVTVFETSMRAVAVACCDHPWTLMLEKPPGMDVADAECIRDAAAKRSRRVVVGLNRRFLSSTQAAYADLEASGGPRFIHVQDQQSLDTARALNHPPEVVARWMYANSIHLVDYLRFFGRGPIRRITPVERWNADHPGVVLAKVEFESGDLGLYEGIWNGPGPWAVTVNTPAKRWEMRPLEEAQFQRAGERKREVVSVAEADRQFKPGFRLQAAQAIAAAQGVPNQAPTLDEALETMQLIREIFA